MENVQLKGVTIAVHGGAGSRASSQVSERVYLGELRDATAAGYRVLRLGGSSREAVVTAVSILEDSPLFNAGRGSVLGRDGTVTMDAALMEGRDRRLGSVMGVRLVKNPIRLAEAILESRHHNTLSGEGALAFAQEAGLELCPAEYFIVQSRREQLERARMSGEKHGTVGAVARDAMGHLAAATSTGGTVDKAYGRIGDSPIIGAGTLADDRTCALSATGRGEEFIRYTVAADIHYRMLYKGETLSQALRFVVEGLLPADCGGVIGLDRTGQIAWAYNTAMMFRGYVDQAGEVQAAMV